MSISSVRCDRRRAAPCSNSSASSSRAGFERIGSVCLQLSMRALRCCARARSALRLSDSEVAFKVLGRVPVSVRVLGIKWCDSLEFLQYIGSNHAQLALRQTNWYLLHDGLPNVRVTVCISFKVVRGEIGDMPVLVVEVRRPRGDKRMPSVQRVSEPPESPPEHDLQSRHTPV